MKSASYEALHCAVFSNLLSFHLSSVKTCSSAPFLYVPPLMPEIKFHTYTEADEKI
jgi:hypothetical protein